MLESYLTPLITSYLSKYIRNIKPSDLQLSFWGGDAVLRNLELRPEAIEATLSGLVPFNLKSGCVKTLTIHIPWTAVGSEAINLSLDNVECSVKLKNLKMSEMSTKTSTDDPKATPTTVTTDQSQPAPGYVQGLMNRILNNIVINVKNLVVNIIQEESDLMMSVSIKSLQWSTTNAEWKPDYVYTDSFQGSYCICKMCSVEGMTVCLDQIGSAGQVEVFELPFVPRCSFECRWMCQYQDGVVVENMVDLMVEELTFSVTQVQFSLFLHLLDWLLAMYYSFKKLKGRDDVDGSGCGQPSEVTINTAVLERRGQEVMEPSSPSPSSPLSPLSPATVGEDEQPSPLGWGSWLMSFVDSDNPDETTPTKASPPPSLSLNLIAKQITIDLKVNQKKKSPVFFATPAKVSTQIMKVYFSGCTAHVSRIPSTTLLGVSVGVASINAFVGGVCPCGLKEKPVSKHRRHNVPEFDDNRVHVYSLGVAEIQSNNSILEGTFYQSNESGPLTWSTTAHPSPKEWLQKRDCYHALWFSYEYYDKGVDREREVCHQSVTLGSHCVIASPDLVHRVGFFVNNFISSLEAVPLFSKGLVVIGDPLAITHLQFHCETFRLVFTSNQHILPPNDGSHYPTSSPLLRDDIASKRKRTPPLSLVSIDSMMMYLKSIHMSVSMPMYSGNATPTSPQEMSLNIECSQLQMHSYCWHTNRHVAELADTTVSSDGLNIPCLLFNVQKKFKGHEGEHKKGHNEDHPDGGREEGGHDGTHCHIKIPHGTILVDHNELLTAFIVYHSWTLQHSNLTNNTLPTIPTASTPTAFNTRPRSDSLSVQLSGIYFEINILSVETNYSLSLQSLSISVIHENTAVPLPVMYCPFDTSNGSIGVTDRDCSPIADEDTLQLCVIQTASTGPGSLSIQLKSLGMVILLERDLLTFVNTTLMGLLKVKGHGTVGSREVLHSRVDHPPDRPDPEGVSNSDPYSPALPITAPHPFSLPMQDNESNREDDTENLVAVDLQSKVLSVLNEIHLNVKMSHIVIASSSLSLHKYCSEDFKTPVDLINSINSDVELVYLVLPTLSIHTTDTEFYRSFATKLPGSSSWQASLADGAVYVTKGSPQVPDYMLHPLSVELSVAPVQSPSVGGVSGYGVHIDVNQLNISLSKDKLSLLKCSLVSFSESLLPFTTQQEPQNTEPKPPPPPPRPPSSLSSPHLSQSMVYNPPTASDSSFSITSSTKAHQPSLWLQCTLTKLIVDLTTNQTEGLRTHRFKYESDDLSFSFDKQGNSMNCQLKVSSLEGHEGEPMEHRGMYRKLFSSKCTVFTDEVLLKVESMNRDTVSPRSPLPDEGTPPVHGLMSHTTFTVLDIRTSFEPHKSPNVKLRVKMFEAVVTLPLVKAVLEMLLVFDNSSNNAAKTGSVDRITEVSYNWPRVDVSMECFRVLLPCLSSSTGVLLDTGGISIRSDLSYPITRMEVNSPAFRRLAILVAEKRIPSLPGYELQLSNIQLMGLSVDCKDQGSRMLSAFPLVSAASTQLQYSPALQWVPSSAVPSSYNRDNMVYATGNLIEICFRSSILMSFGISQIATVFKLSRDYTNLYNTLLNDLDTTCPPGVAATDQCHPINQPPLMEGSHPSNPPYHVLVMTSSLQMNYYQNSNVALQLTLFDPVVEMKRSPHSLSLRTSIFRIESMYHSRGREKEGVASDCVPLVECIGPREHAKNFLSANMELNEDNEDFRIDVDVGRTVCVTLSLELVSLVHMIYVDVALTVGSIPSATSITHSRHTVALSQPPDASITGQEQTVTINQYCKLLDYLKLTVKTMPLTLQILAKSSSCLSDSSENCYDSIKVSCSELRLVLPNLMESHSHSKGADSHSSIQFPSCPLLRGTAVSFGFHCTGLEVMCSSHRVGCANHVSSHLLFPANLRCMIVHYMASKINCARHVLSVLVDPIHLSMSAWLGDLVQSIVLGYSSCIQDLLKEEMVRDKECFDNDKEEDLGSHCKRKVFQDDLRQKDMTFNTTDIYDCSFPEPSEIRFFEGDSITPPHMIWQYSEPRCITRVEVLPVPLGVFAQVGEYPTDITVRCELSYYDGVDGVFMCVGELNLSESATAIWHQTTDEDTTCRDDKFKKTNSFANDVHALIWRLTVLGLEWQEENEEGTLFTARADFPLSDMISTNILSPLSLAGCTCVDSVMDPQYIPSIELGVDFSVVNVSLMHQPYCGAFNSIQHYNGYSVHDDLSKNPLSFCELRVKDMKARWSITMAGHQTAKISGVFSVSIQDFRDLTLREVIHPTRVDADLILTQLDSCTRDVAVSLMLEPCLIRISPTLVHTITMATHSIVNPSLGHPGLLSCEVPPAPVVLFSAHILCNMTNMCLYIGQESTIEWLKLPGRSCIGYHWNTHCCDEQRLRLALTGKENERWAWSSSFLLDHDGLQEITIPSPIRNEEQVYLYAEVTRLSGIQTQVVISGAWIVHSLIPHPLLTCVESHSNQDVVEESSPESLNRTKSISFIVNKHKASLGIMVNGGKWCYVTITSSFSPQQIPIKICDSRFNNLHFWCTISPRSRGNQFKQTPLEITFAPFFKVINNLPFNVTLIIAPNDSIDASGNNQVVSVSGCGQHSYLCSLHHNSWYLVKLSALLPEKGVVSVAFPLSTCIVNQLPVCDDVTDCGTWPYNTCVKHRSPSNSSPKTTPPSTKTVSLPIDENSDSMVTVHIELQRDRSTGVVLVSLTPDVLVVNETGEEVCLLTDIDFNKETIVDGCREGHRSNITAVIKRNEEFKIRLSPPGTKGSYMKSSPLSLLVGSGSKDKQKRITRVKLQNDQIGGEIVMEVFPHCNSVLATLKPSHIVINNTGHPLSIWPILHGNQSSNTWNNISNDSVVAVASSESKAIGIWSIKGAEDERLFHFIKVSSQCNAQEPNHWSIPLLLNFVRHSFSLPLLDDNSITPTNIPCLLTTHEMDGTMYLVIASNPAPRLVVKNNTSHVLEIREAHTQWIHSHSQTIYPHSQSVYEPPSSAMQYPLIREWIESETEENNGTIQFKHLSDLDIQIGYPSRDCHVTWSHSFKIPSGVLSKIETITIPQLEDSIDVMFDLTGRTGIIEFILSNKNDSTRSIGSPPILKSRGTMSGDLCLCQLVLVLDTEDPHIVRPLLVVTGDDTRVKVNHTPSVLEIGFTMDSLQVDGFIDSSQGQVFLCPRTQHEPPASLLKPHPHSFISIDLEMHTEDNILSNIDVSLQPVTIRVDDVMVLKVVDGFVRCKPPSHHVSWEHRVSSEGCLVQLNPLEVIAEADRDKLPILIQRLNIAPLKVYLTAHMTRVISLSCDDAFLRFSDIVLSDTYTSSSELSQFVSLHYITGVVMQLGWVLGSLDLIGSPSSLMYRLQNGLYNFVYLPYEGITRGPGFFMLGVGRGVSSLMANVSGGVLKAVTNISTSLASNLERLSLDPDHESYQLALRQGQESRGFGSSLYAGVSGLGMSLVSAVAGVVDQPMQVVHQSGTDDDPGSFTRQMVAGVGRGLLGLVTKPVGGALQLVAQTGQGIITSSGLVHTPSIRRDELHTQCVLLRRKTLRASFDKYKRLLRMKHNSASSGVDHSLTAAMNTVSIVFYSYATITLPRGSSYDCLVMMDSEKVYAFDTETDTVLVSLNIGEFQCEDGEEHTNLTSNETSTGAERSSPKRSNPLKHTSLNEGTTSPREHITDVECTPMTIDSSLPDSLPKLGGKRVILTASIRQPRQRVTSCSSGGSHSSEQPSSSLVYYYHSVDRYLEYSDSNTTNNNEDKPLQPSSPLASSDVIDKQRKQFTIVFTDSNCGRLFKSIFDRSTINFS